MVLFSNVVHLVDVLYLFTTLRIRGSCLHCMCIMPQVKMYVFNVNNYLNAVKAKYSAGLKILKYRHHIQTNRL